MNKKISSLENHNTRLSLMNKQAVEIVDKTTKEASSKTPNIQDASEKIKCSLENSGTCRNKTCKYVHPSKTCQAFSKLGSCSSETSCELRHPQRTCFNFERHGSCNRGDSCRFRHPLEFQAFRNQHQSHAFLGRRDHQYRKPHPHEAPQDWYHQNSQQPHQNKTHQDSHQNKSHPKTWIPDNIRHHDLRGSRW